MELLSGSFLNKIYKEQKESTLFGKWIVFDDLKKLFTKHNGIFQVLEIGTSEENKPIMSLKIGSGKKKILLWSQMHGNESTGTKALFDIFNCFSNHSDTYLTTILKECTLLFIPMLNPDGAQVYKRVNAQKIDLNRDAVDRKAKESKLLRRVVEDFNPLFSFNLHDQRTIFGVEGTKNPATISFLAPSEEETRVITDGRAETMNVIVSMNKVLQRMIPNFVGRYTDEFYPTATGDTFQKLGFNTILIESGHYPNDYDREKSREYTFYALLQGMFHVATALDFSNYDGYFDIPNNQKLFYDVIHRYSNSDAIGYQFVDEIHNYKFTSRLQKVAENDIISKIGHNEIVFVSNIY